VYSKGSLKSKRGAGSWEMKKASKMLQINQIFQTIGDKKVRNILLCRIFHKVFRQTNKWQSNNKDFQSSIL
jgi:hypothetical protein